MTELEPGDWHIEVKDNQADIDTVLAQKADQDATGQPLEFIIPEKVWWVAIVAANGAVELTSETYVTEDWALEVATRIQGQESWVIE